MKGLIYKLNLLVGIAILSSVHESNGMFDCILSTLEMIDKDCPYGNFNNVKVARFNRTTFVVNGSFEFFLDSIEGFIGTCNAFKKMGNEYRLLPYKIGPVNICDILRKKTGLFYPAFLEATENFPPLGSCNFTSGIVYKIKNYLPNLDRVPPVFESGDYMIECNATKDERFMQGIKASGQVYNIASASSFKG